MKKTIIISMLFLLTGCSTYTKTKMQNKFQNKLNNLNSYYIEGTMQIKNQDDTYTYQVKSAYQKEDKYKISLINQANNHEQIILKNKEGVYILTPSLNKSFKFQSDWPYNNSSAYILKSIEEDLINDKTKKYDKNKLMFTLKANYPNNKELKKERIYFNKNYMPKKVEVLNKEGKPEIIMNYTKLKINKTFSKNYFNLNKTMETSKQMSKTKEVNKIEDEIFPMYIPKNTKLEKNEKIKTKSGERIIMTFKGEKPFTIVEETKQTSKNMQIINMEGDILSLPSALGSINDGLIVWNENNKEYYVMSEKLSKNELREVASSLSTLPLTK